MPEMIGAVSARLMGTRGQAAEILGHYQMAGTAEQIWRVKEGGFFRKDPSVQIHRILRLLGHNPPPSCPQTQPQSEHSEHLDMTLDTWHDMKPEPKILPLVGGKMLVAPSEPGTAVSGDQTLVSPWGPALSVSMCQPPEHAHRVCCRDHAVNIVIKTVKVC